MIRKKEEEVEANDYTTIISLIFYFYNSQVMNTRSAEENRGVFSFKKVLNKTSVHHSALVNG